MASNVRVAFDVATYVWRHPANKGRRLRRLLMATSYQLKGRLSRLPTVVAIGTGTRVIAYPHSTPAAKAVYANPPDWPEMLTWKHLLSPGDLFVDVGANIGTYSLWAADLGAHVIAIEPNRVAADRFRENFDLNGYEFLLYDVALADQAGTVCFDGSSDAGGHITGDGDTIATMTVDGVLGDRWAAGVKIDVEGAERRVLEGASRALAEHRIGCLQVEWNHQSEVFYGESRQPVGELLRQFGYRLMRPDAAGQLTEPASDDFGPDVFAILD